MQIPFLDVFVNQTEVESKSLGFIILFNGVQMHAKDIEGWVPLLERYCLWK